jgi:predicted DNA-binding protein YlxM (UPF0122 family)
MVIINKTSENKKDIQELKDTIIEKFGDCFPIFEIKKTTAFNKIYENKMSLKEILEKFKMFNFAFTGVIKQLNEITDYIENIKLNINKNKE